MRAFFDRRFIVRTLREHHHHSQLHQRKVRSLVVLYPLFLLAAFIFIAVAVPLLGVGTDIWVVATAAAAFAVGFACLRFGFYRVPIYILIGTMLLILSTTVFLAENHEPVKMYNLAVYCIISLLIAGLVGDSVSYSYWVFAASWVLMTAYLVFLVIPAGLKPMALTLDSYISSMVLTGLAFLISVFVHRQLNGFIHELSDINEELDTLVVERTRQLEDSHGRLIESEKLSALGGVVIGMAHEVNTPLGVAITANSHFLGALDSLKEHYRAKDGDLGRLGEFLAVSDDTGRLLETNLHRLRELVGRFQELSLDSSGRVPTLFGVREQIDLFLRLYGNQEADLPDVSLVVEGDPELSFSSYPEMIQPFLFHLLDNAMAHAFPEGKGTVRIEYRKSGEWLVVTVRDDGAGMDEETRSRVFEPFFTTNRGRGHAGLGMIVVYNLVMRAGGEIDIESEPGRGTVVTARIPEA